MQTAGTPVGGLMRVWVAHEKNALKQMLLLPQLLLFLDDEHFPTKNKCDYIKIFSYWDNATVIALIVLELLTISIDIGIGICWFSQATNSH